MRPSWKEQRRRLALMMRPKNPPFVWPEHAKDEYGSARGFRNAKRREITAVRKALKVLRNGCAYLPDHGKSAQAASALMDTLRDACLEHIWRGRGREGPA